MKGERDATIVFTGLFYSADLGGACTHGSDRLCSDHEKDGKEPSLWYHPVHSAVRSGEGAFQKMGFLLEDVFYGPVPVWTVSVYRT